MQPEHKEPLMYPKTSYYRHNDAINTTDSQSRFHNSHLLDLVQPIRSLWRRDLRDFYSYLALMARQFKEVQRGLAVTNPSATHHNGDDRYSAGWAGYGMLPMAAYLYYLKTSGVSGSVLECGVFKGGSTCCLSYACDYLGLRLIAADSFQGLPESDSYYSKGDFFGSLDEVKRNVELFGKPSCVTFLSGWFSESLASFQDDLMLLWIDVDLKSSVLDVLENAFDCLVRDGVIFCDGLGETRDFDGDELRAGSPESEGLLEFFHNRNLSHKAVYTGVGHMGLVVPGAEVDQSLVYSRKSMDKIVLIVRAWLELERRFDKLGL
ncbi:MAG: hypothetical protein C1943_03280 [Halochromatium sp.]|nr:hypothetical protein [Halochromatium sp.]